MEVRICADDQLVGTWKKLLFVGCDGSLEQPLTSKVNQLTMGMSMMPVMGIFVGQCEGMSKLSSPQFIFDKDDAKSNRAI